MKMLAPPRSLILFVSKVTAVWRQWDIQTMVVTSLAFQLILILLSPFRKQTSNFIVIGTIWLAYLLADWVAAQAIGLIARATQQCGSATPVAEELYGFWAQFLLLHLGGPETITALALEDNELWLRMGLHLGAQVYGSLGIIVRSISPYQSSRVWAPTLLMFVAGILKYLERLASLFYGRLPCVSEMELPQPANAANDGDEKSGYFNLVRKAYSFLRLFKKLYGGKQTVFFHDSSLSYFRNRTPEDAFTVLEIELNLAYEAFYTKAVVLYTSWIWKILRIVVTLLQVVCLVLWLFCTNKHGFPRNSITITYALVFGAIFVELLALVRMQFSYWTIALVDQRPRIKTWVCKAEILAQRTWGRYWRIKDAPIWECFRRVFFRRWSESISQLNVISMCMDKELPEHMKKVVKFLGLKKVVDRTYVTKKWFSNNIRDFIFEDLKEQAYKQETDESRENIGHTKGSWACKRFMPMAHDSKFLFYTSQLFKVHWEYDVILLRWHVITELCYLTHDEYTNTAENLEEGGQLKDQDYREICKTLSDYMIYLLVHQPKMMPPAAGESTKARLEKMCFKLRSFMSDPKRLGSAKSKISVLRSRVDCNSIETRSQKVPIEDRITNIFPFPIDEIMTELEELDKVKDKVKDRDKFGKWKFMAVVWAELVYYAAIRSPPRLHAAKLRKGGELLSLVWLLLFQFGFGMFEINYVGLEFKRPETDRGRG